MKPIFAIVMAGMLCAGCASIAPSPEPPRGSLDQADARLAAEDYSGAQALYAEFVNASPGNPQAVRARAIQAALDRLLSSQAELDRQKRSDEVPRLRREIAERKGDVERLKAELAERHGEVERLKAENAKLRADLGRLKNIDLQTLPGAKQ
jgi:flagellar motility protein MotE (MotC chaperone)